jgi:Ankyrin repeats (3 copies)
LKAKYRSVSSSVLYENAIYYAAMGGHEDVVWFLIGRCTYFSSLLHVKSMTMVEGAKGGRLGICRMMLDHGIDVSFRDEARHSTLQWSAFRGHLRVAQLLLEYGADAKWSDQLSLRVIIPCFWLR